MIDIHTHIIPGVDDGSKTIEESIRIIKNAVSDGVKTIVAAPHVFEIQNNINLRKIHDTFDLLQKRLISEDIKIKIILAAELSISPDLPKVIKSNKELTINSKNRYILMELPMQEIPSFTEQIIFDLLVENIIPIITHPERYFDIWKDPNKLFKLVQKGALTHVNTGSLMGKYGKKSLNTAKILLSHNLIHMIGSDVHSSSNGYYPLSKGVNEVAKIVGLERAEKMATSIPEKVVNGERIDVIPPKPIEKGIFSKFFG